MTTNYRNVTQLSIIVATYNADAFLSKALNSIVSLTYKNWECIIVDGASTDDTLDIIMSFEEKDPRIRHISEPDKGLYDAFNKGWRIASGKWVYYLGCDDMLTPDGLLQLMKRAESVDENVAIVSGGVIRVRQDGSRRIMLSKGFISSHQSMIMRRTVLQNMNGFDDAKYEILADYDLFIRIKNNGYQVINCDAIIAYFHAGGTSERLSSVKTIFKEKYSILKTDRFCNYPLMVTLHDLCKTILGNIYHRSMKFLKKNKHAF